MSVEIAGKVCSLTEDRIESSISAAEISFLSNEMSEEGKAIYGEKVLNCFIAYSSISNNTYDFIMLVDGR